MQFVQFVYKEIMIKTIENELFNFRRRIIQNIQQLSV